MLEQVLAQVDLAHGSTQRVSRDFMRAAKSPRGRSAACYGGDGLKGRASAVTAATVPGGIVRGTDATAAASLLSVPVQKTISAYRADRVWVGRYGIRCGGGNLFFALRSPASSAKPALWQPHEVLITQSADLADIALESVAASSPQAVAKIIATYRTARSKILAHVASAYAADSVFIPLRRIVEIPKDSVCEAIVKDAARLSCDDLAQYPFYFRFSDDKTLFLAETANPDDLELMFLTAMVDAIPMGQQNDQAALKLRGELQTFVDSVAPKNAPAPK